MVRVVVPDVLDATQCGLLANDVGYRPWGALGFDNPLVSPVVGAVRDKFDVALEDPSFVRVECRKEGHDWHCDNGKHMPWCGVSASILLAERPDDGVGGVLEFADDVPAQEPGALWVWDQDKQNRHRVTPHNGWRICLLMFLQGEYGTA